VPSVGAVSLSIAIAWCASACAYQPGSFHGRRPRLDFAGERATVGCLDIAVAGRWKAADVRGQVVEIDFGNRCDRPVVVDFTSLRAVGRDDGGREQALAVYDPAGEIRPLDLEARTVGREVLELRPAALAAPASPGRLRSACLDLGRLRGGPAERWICIARPPGAAAASGQPGHASGGS
jgi:hypothetical protein